MRIDLKVKLLLVVSLATTLGLAACGGDDDGESQVGSSDMIDSTQPANISVASAPGVAGLTVQSFLAAALIGDTGRLIIEGSADAVISAAREAKSPLPVLAACPRGGTISASWLDAVPIGQLSVNDRARLAYRSCLLSDFQLAGLADLLVQTLQGEPGIDTNWQASAKMSFASVTTALQVIREQETGSMGGGAFVSVERQGTTRIVTITDDGIIQFADQDFFLTDLTPYSVTITDTDGQFQISGSGTISSNYIGQVSIEITRALVGNKLFEGFPSGGEILITGGDSKKVLVKIVDATQVTLEVDDDGDGISDQAVPISWLDLIRAADDL